MKKLLLITLIYFLSLGGNAQTTKKYTVKPLISEREIYLNGGAKASLGGKSRTTIKIDLPKNTVSWYYSFTTSADASGTKNLNLAIQLSSLAFDQTGFTKAVLSNVEVPPGSGSIDVYVMDQNNSDLFLEKVDNNGGKYYYIREGIAENTKQAVINIDDFSTGTYYIGLKNPSSLNGINIKIEVAAIVEEIVTVEKTMDAPTSKTQTKTVGEIKSSDQNDNKVKALNYGNLGWKCFERGEYDKCFELSKKALELDKSWAFVYFNIGLYYLIKGQAIDAIDSYNDALIASQKDTDSKHAYKSLKGASQDITDYMDKFLDKNTAKDIQELLINELKKY